MSDVLDRIEANSLTTEGVQRIRDFINADATSTMSILLRRILTATEDGHAINIFTDDEELSPNEVAKLLKMSRPHLLTFLDNGQLPYHHVGTHKRIKMSDLKAFMKSRDEGAEILANARHRAVSPSPVGDIAADARAELDEL